MFRSIHQSHGTRIETTGAAIESRESVVRRASALPCARSLSPHIVLREAGFTFSTERVNLKTHHTAGGVTLASVHGKDYVPILELDNGERLTEGPAIVQYLAEQKPAADLLPAFGSMERYRVLEWLDFITTELDWPRRHRPEGLAGAGGVSRTRVIPSTCACRHAGGRATDESRRLRRAVRKR